MTSENDLDVIKEEILMNEEEKPIMDEKKEESAVELDIKNEKEPSVVCSEESVELKEEEQTNSEEVKHINGRKKRDVAVKSEIETISNELDTQPLFEQPIIVEGKRSRKPTLRLELSELAPPKKELSIPQGHGKPLGEIEYINYRITHASTDALSRMRYICFGRRGVKANIRKNLREFKGFEFERDSDEYQKHLSNLTKLKKDQLRSISDILALPSTGRNTEHAERILNFLIEPIDEGKRIPERKIPVRTFKKRSTNSKESIDTDEEKTKKEKTENGDDKDKSNQNDDYIYKPGKRSSNHQNPANTKRKRGTSTTFKSKAIINEEITTTPIAADEHQDNGKEIDDNLCDTNSKLIDQNEAISSKI